MSYSSAVENFRFSTTDYCTVELASSAKLTLYSLRPIQEKGSNFSQDTPRHRVCNQLSEYNNSDWTGVVGTQALVRF